MPDLILPSHLVQEGPSELEQLKMVAGNLGSAIQQLIQVANNHKEVIEQQNDVINLHGERIKRLEDQIKRIRKRQKEAGFRVIDDSDDQAPVQPGATEEEAAAEAAAQDGPAAGETADTDQTEVTT